MKVLLVEDHVVVRQMFAQAIGLLSDFKVVGEAADIQAAMELCRETDPDVIVLDLNLNGGSGLEVLELLQTAGSKARCLIFSGITTPAVLQRALALGAKGIVEKTGTLKQLTEALHSVAQGDTYLSPAILAILRQFNSRPNAAMGDEDLTAREREVLLLIAQGMSNKEVASQLGISVHTAENHRASLIRKTGLQSQAKLTMFAIQMGLIQPS